MNPPSNLTPEFPIDLQGITPAVMPATRPLFWSVRREVWENRSVYIAPLVVAAVVLFASAISTMTGLPGRMRNLPTLSPAKQHVAVVKTLLMAPAPIMFVTFLVGLFYSLDALYGERRDRSILFWKSLPVSDLTIVLSKAIIPLVVLPLIAFILSVVAQLLLLFVSNAVMLMNGMSPVRLWTEFQFFEGLPVMLYGLAVHALWFAPIYGWLLLISAWARRAPFLWAVLPLLAVSAVERIAAGTSHFMTMLQYRVVGAMAAAFAIKPKDGSAGTIDQISQLTPVRFMSSPGLWIGLVFAVACLAIAVRLRRNREPI